MHGKPDELRTMALVQRVFLVSCLIYCKSVIGSTECKSPRYVEVYSVGVIQCSFREDVFGVLWYNSTNTFGKSPIMALENSVKSGHGYDRGEFDIFANGSLIINNVSFSHEGTYTVIKVESRQTALYTVSVLVVAHTFIGQPLLDNCEYTNKVCVQSLDKNPDVSCSVKDARSAISLKWMIRTIDGDRNISSHLVITEETSYFFTSRSTVTNPFAYSTMLTLLVCKANDPTSLLVNDESLVLIQKSNGTATIVMQKRLFLEEDSKVELNCSDSNILFLVWQVKQSSENAFEDILYTVFDGSNLTYIYNENYKLERNSSIVVDQVRVYHEGTYRCISGNGLQDDVIMYDVEVFVYPQPPYLVVDGCDHQQYCVLEVQTEGSLTCTVKGIRPQVDLEFSDAWGHDLNHINIYDKAITITDNGDTFDVLLTSKYRFTGALKLRVTVECKILGTNIPELHLSSKFDLLFLQGIESFTEESVSSSDQKFWIIAAVLQLQLIIFLPCGFLIVKVCRRRYLRRNHPRQNTTVNHMEISTIAHSSRNDGRDKMRYLGDPIETLRLLPNSHGPAAKTIFIRQLIQKYENLYLAVQPIPYIRDRLFCVDKVFVEGGIEYLDSNDVSGRADTWCKLNSYKDIFHDMKIQSVRRIIEGEHGFGKSTLTLQIAYDWCKSTPNSVSSKYELLILLRLKEFSGVTSIFRAIKQFLLSPDCCLSEVDIQQILKDIKSVLVIFDGFDEYPDRNSNVASHVKSIIKRDMFQAFDVVLTTRTACLPKDPAPQTKRIRLTGFDDYARDEYIRKAVVGNDEEAVMTIKLRLQQNPVLADLCQVPLFFTMYAHMSHENKDLQMFKSVTSFFRYMIWCFHHHFKNKAKEDNVQEYSSFEGNHHKLDEVAFEGLNNANQQLVWERESLRKRLGQNFYDHYVRLGILVEEEVLDIKSDSPTDTHLVPQKKEVRFYHKLFCEWYAAHFLSNYAGRYNVRYMGNNNLTFFHKVLGRKDISNLLQNLDPFDLQYVFRFVCGLNPHASGKIIEYLKNKENAHRFAVLCILEKENDIHNIVDSVRDICSKTVRISPRDTSLLQRSTIQLLEVAAKNGISISSVYLSNCYSTVNLSGGNHLQLKSNLSVPVLTTLNKLTINTYGEGREITAEEFAGILQYSSKCLALMELWVRWCLLPQSVQAESVSVLRSKNVKVYWYPRGISSGPKYQLNLFSGLWQRYSGEVMTDQEYQIEVIIIRAEKELRNTNSDFPYSDSSLETL